IYFDETNNNNIIVELMIDNNFKLPKNTIASIFSSDLMGTKAVKFLLTDSTSYHSVGDTLLPMVEADLTEQVSVQMLPLKNQAEDLMKDMQEALVVLKQLFNEKTRDNLIRSIESVKSTINNLNNTTSAIDELLNSEKENLKNIISNIESITKSIKSNNKELGMAIQNLSDISDSIARANITTVLNNIETSFLQLSEITEKINQGQGSLGTLVNNDTLIKNLETTAKDLDILIKDINENPKKYVHFSVIGIGSGKKGKSDK
ncbi:MAG: hypothetical protein JXB17_01050, partial [Bacteroidales bacterium]|nr:hypothetical protein [Bacteroidales bacterium]